MQAPPKLASRKRITELALRGEEGRGWYRDAHCEILDAAPSLGVTPKRLADLLSLFSPRVQVRKSVTMTIEYVRTGIMPGIALASVAAAVEHYEASGEIRGPKTRPFASALMGDEDAIVLDTWMAVAFELPASYRWAPHYVAEPAERMIRRIAAELYWTPATTQAAIWCGVMRERGRKDSRLDLKKRLTVADHVLELT